MQMAADNTSAARKTNSIRVFSASAAAAQQREQAEAAEEGGGGLGDDSKVIDYVIR